jgi:hypothetical protein
MRNWNIGIGIFVGAVLFAIMANAPLFTRQEVLAFESATMPAGDFLTARVPT